MPIVNDIHSRLNATKVADIATPRDPDELRAAILDAAARGLAVSIAGGRHAMGGQQFCAGGVLVDTTAMRRTLAFDSDRGLLEMEAGAQ
jgi:FAD/FMN-containing dehydrogenase